MSLVHNNMNDDETDDKTESTSTKTDELFYPTWRNLITKIHWDYNSQR